MHHRALMCWLNWELHRACSQLSQQSYEALTEALAYDPKNAELWYNRSSASRFTSRFGQSLRDIEHAIELNTRSELTEQLTKELRSCRKMAEASIYHRRLDHFII